MLARVSMDLAEARKADSRDEACGYFSRVAPDASSGVAREARNEGGWRYRQEL
jgi:hypothetical protein